MNDELSIRQMAIRLRLAGESVESICSTLKRSKSWFHKWWQRYLTLGPEGLYNLTRANHQVARRTPPHIERAVLSVRRRLGPGLVVDAVGHQDDEGVGGHAAGVVDHVPGLL